LLIAYLLTANLLTAKWQSLVFAVAYRQLLIANCVLPIASSETRQHKPVIMARIGGKISKDRCVRF
jgi:hypothetical protein